MDDFVKSFSDQYIDALEFTKIIADKLSNLSNKAFYLRNDDNLARSLIDEMWPLATFGKILYHPNRIVKIKYFGLG